ncbi:bifunctional lysylphosphatidylglycerol flippase/synthetase MprF [Clostridium sp.]|uniref:bifunctional lysylphosphatidylglycerol flippase/synthetase MprF n=1 Tax=Clostridium sp. TaxID=1506 RepID=UPI003D6D64BD
MESLNISSKLKFILIYIREFFISKGVRILKVTFSLLIVLLIYFEGKSELSSLNLTTSLSLLRSFEPIKLLSFFIAGSVAVSCMTFYDYFIIRNLKYKISLLKTIRISWISNTFNNFLGFGGLTGAGIRTLLYSEEKVSHKECLFINALLVPATTTGLSILALLGIFNILPMKPILADHKWFSIAVIFFAIYLFVYLLLFKIKWIRNKVLPEGISVASSTPLRIELIFASIFEWTGAGIFLWYISSNFISNITLLQILPILTVAASVGIFSMVPGGLGSFDLVCILGLKLVGASSSKALAILFLYRAFYYVIPWILGAIMAIIGMITKTGEDKATEPSLWNKFLDLPKKNIFLSDLGIWALSLMVFLSGIVLLFSAATPSIAGRIEILTDISFLSVMHISNRASIAIGLMLLVLSWKIKERLKRAFNWTLVLLILGALTTFMKGLDFEEAIFLLIIALLLWLSKSRYYRESAPIKKFTVLLYLGITAVSIFIYALLGNSIHANFLKSGNSFYVLTVRPRAFWGNAIFAFIVCWIFVFFLLSTSSNTKFNNKPQEADIEKLKLFLKKYKGNYLTHLIFLKDKNLYWAQNDRVLLAYGDIGNKLVVLGDPIGDPSLFKKAIEDFQIFADKFGHTPVFYQVSEKYLPHYHENGYYFFKLGEEAIINLDTFSIAGGGRNQSLRSAKNRMEKENFKFEILNPPFSSGMISEIRNISEIWLGKRKEKGFSLGFFNEDYIQSSPVAVFKNNLNKIVAFATIMPAYDDASLSIDLMRFDHSACPNGTMEALFVNLINWSKEQNYKYFNIGMAPLSNVGLSPFAHEQEKLAKFVYKFGNYWYKFSGLRNYKEKFHPDWEPRYLAYPKFISLPTLLIELAILISKDAK